MRKMFETCKKGVGFFTQFGTEPISFIDKELQEKFVNIIKKSVEKFYTFVLNKDVANLCGLSVDTKNQFFSP